MSKRVSNKRGTTHRDGVKPARSYSGSARHYAKIQERLRRQAALDRRHEMMTEVRRRFADKGDGAPVEDEHA